MKYLLSKFFYCSMYLITVKTHHSLKILGFCQLLGSNSINIRKMYFVVSAKCQGQLLGKGVSNYTPVLLGTGFVQIFGSKIQDFSPKQYLFFKTQGYQQ